MISAYQRALSHVVNDDDDSIPSDGSGSESVLCDDMGDPTSTSTASSPNTGSRVSAQCAKSIEKIVLQVLGGTRSNDVRLEHTIDVNTCLAVG